MKKTTLLWKLSLSFLLGAGLSYAITYSIQHMGKHDNWDTYLREIEQKSLDPLGGILVINPQSWEVSEKVEANDNIKPTASLISASELEKLPTNFNHKNRLCIYLLDNTNGPTYSKNSFFNQLLEQSTPEQKVILNLVHKYVIEGIF